MIPMNLFLTLFVVALAWTVGVAYVAVRGSVAGGEITTRTGIVLSALGVILWGLVAMFAFSVVSYSGGQEFTHEIPELAFVAVIGGGIMLLSLLQATVQSINETGGIV